MPFISTESVKEIRNELKNKFPDIKFSVIKEHYSSIIVALMESKNPDLASLNGQYEQVNHYYIKDNYKDQPKIRDILLKINNIVSRNNYTVSVDSDYGNIPNFYINIHIGRWDKPFVYIN